MDTNGYTNDVSQMYTPGNDFLQLWPTTCRLAIYAKFGECSPRDSEDSKSLTITLDMTQPWMCLFSLFINNVCETYTHTNAHAQILDHTHFRHLLSKSWWLSTIPEQKMWLFHNKSVLLYQLVLSHNPGWVTRQVLGLECHGQLEGIPTEPNMANVDKQR